MTTAARTTTYALDHLAWLSCGITIGSRGGWHPATPEAARRSPACRSPSAVVLLGFIKGRMIIRYFMEVRTAPRWLKLITDAWLTVLWAAVLAIYLF